MGILRSEEMRHGTLVIPADRAFEIVHLLGEKGNLMITDMNSASMHRPYRRYVQRIEEMERMLRYLIEEINKLPGTHIEKDHIQEFLGDETYVLEGVEQSLQNLYGQFVRFRANNDDLLKQRTRAMMERAVAKVAQASLTGASKMPSVGQDMDNAGASEALLQQDVEARGGTMMANGFSSFAGVVLQGDQDKLVRTVFRATRGNAFSHVEDLNEEFIDEATGQLQKRSVFVVYYQGGPGSAMHEKISRICKAFGVETFAWPRSANEAVAKAAELDGVINDKSRALEAFEEFFFDEVSVLLDPPRAGGNSLVEDWRLFCQKQKSLYACLNLFEETDATLRADCWYPAEEEESTRELLSDFSGPNTVSAFLLTDKDSHHHRNPPTYIKTTEFTEAFQNFVDTFGIPRYQEANPALLSIFTFPFLFGIMYGDIGHGSLVTMFGIFLLVRNQKLKRADSEVTQMIAFGRYMIFMMGLCAIYCGFVYNDFFSLGVDIFGTRYGRKSVANEVVTYTPDKSKSFPYPFGFDPIWKGADNELDMFNSFKMKTSVIFAYVHMMAGIILKGFNAVYFRDHLTLWFEWIPQIIFFTGLVGYMDFLIIYKWLSAYHGQPRASIISTLIGMTMLKEVKPEDQFYSHQQTVERVLLLVMVISIPWMLFPKPILAKIAWNRAHPNYAAAKKEAKERAKANNHLEERVPLGQGGAEGSVVLLDEDEEEPFEFGENFIHQVIETIEFVIGAISNTASYLRLWALSLAHQQLALVFFEQILLNIIGKVVKAENNNVAISAIAIFLGFGAFAGATFAIMLCMDTLECYLHALRLHWVEFQNKFYKADGYRFAPFNFYRILAGIE